MVYTQYAPTYMKYKNRQNQLMEAELRLGEGDWPKRWGMETYRHLGLSSNLKARGCMHVYTHI